MTVAFRAGDEGHATTTTPNVTVPGTAQVGDVGLLQFTQNSSDVLTATPPGLNLIDLNTGTVNFPNRLYWFVVDGSTIAASTALGFTLSVTRQWSLALALWSGLDPVSPFIDYRIVSGAASSATPSYTTVENTWPVELAAAKSNGTTITGWTPPSGWTQRAMAPSINTFGGSAIIADRDAGQVAGGVGLGSDTYTPNQAQGWGVLYTVALRPFVVATPVAGDLIIDRS